jgi:8-oxo-dGDP phosphatase
MTEGNGAWFETVDRRTVYEGLSRVVVEKVRTPDGSEVDREIVEHPDAVAIVPVDDRGRVLLLRQYRQALRSYLLEIPAGKLDVDGETPEAAAQRELVEEVGCRAGELTLLGTMHNSAGWTTERTHLYLGRRLDAAVRPEEFTPHAEEADMEVTPFAVTDAVQLARSGELTDAKTIVGLLLAEPHL